MLDAAEASSALSAEAWEGAVPVCFALSEDEVSTAAPPPDVYVRAALCACQLGPAPRRWRGAAAAAMPREHCRHACS